MSDLFSPTRFRRLLLKHTSENWKRYLVGACVLAGTLALVIGLLSYMMSSPPTVSAQAILFDMFLLGAGFWFTTDAFAEYASKNRAITALTFPAAQSEKFLIAWLYSGPIFLFTYCLLFFLVDGLILSWFRPVSLQHLREILSFTDTAFPQAFILFALVHGVALYFSIRFDRFIFIKAASSFFVGLFVLFTLNFWALKALLGKTLLMALPFMGADMHEQDQVYHLAPPNAYWAELASVGAAVVVVLWLAAYARLREKQL